MLIIVILGFVLFFFWSLSLALSLCEVAGLSGLMG